MSNTSENWRRTSRSCFTGQVKKSEIPKRAGTTDKSISTGIKYWVCCIKEPFYLKFVHNLFWIKLKWNTRSKFFYCIIYRCSIWSSRTLTKLKSQSQKRFNERKYQYLKYKISDINLAPNLNLSFVQNTIEDLI